MNIFGNGNQQHGLAGQAAGGMGGAHGGGEAAEGGAPTHGLGHGGQGQGHAAGGGGGDDDGETMTTQANRDIFNFHNPWGVAAPTTQSPHGGGDDDGPAVTETPHGAHGARGNMHTQGNFFNNHGLRGNGFTPRGNTGHLKDLPFVPDWMIKRIQLAVYREMRQNMFETLLQCVQEKLRDTPANLPSTRNYNNFLF